MPTSKAEAREWLIRYANVTLPLNTCGNPKCTASPMDALWYAYTARTPRSVWWGSRGFSGKSATLACLVYLEAVTLGVEVTLLGGSYIQSQRVHQYLVGERRSLNKGRVFWNAAGAPTHLLEGEPTKSLTKLNNGGSIEVLTASQKSVRGPHPQRLRGDEIDEMDKAIWDAAQGQAQGAGGVRAQTVGSSTWQNAVGTMTAEMKEAREKGYPVHRWCYRCVMEENGGWLTQQEVDDKKSTIPAYMWDVEYELNEPSSEGTLFDRPALERMFRKSLGSVEGGLNTTITFKEPVDGAEYATGGDWGKERDRSIIITLRTDVKPMEVVRYRHMGRVPFPQMVGAFNEDVSHYDSAACHDATGIGAVIDDYLEVMSEAVKMVGKKRSDLFGQYVVAVEQGDLACPSIGYLVDEHKFCTVDDVYGAGHPPDTVVAMAMAWRAANGLPLFI